MSILISEINMPEGEGCKLVLQIFPSGEVYDEHGFRLGLTKWAKAVPVPPHGRLIEDVAVREQIDEWLDSVGDVVVGRGLSYYGELLGCIEDAPTIIEAEEEPNGRAQM